MRGGRCVKVRKELGERVRKELVGLECLDNRLKPRSDEDFVYLPVKEGDIPYETMEIAFEERKSVELTSSYDVVGDIAIIKEDLGGDAILSAQKNIKVVVKQASAVEGLFRRRKFHIVAGERRTETVHREYGCFYALDIEKVYFNPRLSTERGRVAGLVKKDETVVDMFAGAGFFSIQVAKRAKNVIAIDINPYAIEYLKRNIRLNRIGNIDVLEGDVRSFTKILKNRANRIIMNLPHNAHEFLGDAIAIIKDGGTIHYYDICDEPDPFGDAIASIKDVTDDRGVEVRVLNERNVKTYAPHRHNVVIDAMILKPPWLSGKAADS